MFCSGDTLHHTFALPIHQGYENVGGKGLSAKRTEEMRNKFKDLMIVIVDEISMVSSTNFHMINDRLNYVFGVTDNEVFFGGRPFIVLGDLYQLPPVGFCSQKRKNN
jgi:hypothetical protein